MKKFLLCFAVALLVFACKRDPVPKNAIPRDKFVDVLVDVHIAEGIFNDKRNLILDSIDSEQLYRLVLKKHNVTDEKMLLKLV